MSYCRAAALMSIEGESEPDADAGEAFRREIDELIESERDVLDALDE